MTPSADISGERRGMSAQLTIPAGERGVVRLFALGDQLGKEIAQSGTLDRLYRALGLEYLHDDDVQVVQIAAISHMGLAAFLSDAYDIDPAEIAPQADTLNAMTGEIAILRSGAFGGHAVDLETNSAATLIATFGEPTTDWSAHPMQTDSARSRIPPRAARSQARRIGLALFSGMMTLILVVIIWIFA